MTAEIAEATNEIADAMVESGIDRKVADKLAPIALIYLVDPDAAKEKLVAEEPDMAAILGWIVKH